MMRFGACGGSTMDGVIETIDVVVREATLFAAVGFAIGGIDDLAVDLLYLLYFARGRVSPMTLDALPLPKQSGSMVVFVPAWDEAAVIGAMLTTALQRYRHDDYRIMVGLYPNDPATIAEVAGVAARDARVLSVIGADPGPTTKAGCLNNLWRALQQDGQQDGMTTKAVVLHDAEDVVHPDELRVFDSLIEHYAVVQLPVLPLVKHRARLVSGHYADEFAEAHAKQLVVRTALGAALPLAGVGCAIAMPSLVTMAAMRGGDPFDADSLTEDYEMGLCIAELGGCGMFARVTGADGLVAVRAYFPATVGAAVRQKARWMIGIALAGWDRTGWARASAIGDHWMRMRDRRAPLAVVVLAAAYLSLVGWAIAAALHWYARSVVPAPSVALAVLLSCSAALLTWRLAMRMVFTGASYGWREALWAVPRLVVGNAIALLAARRAMMRYLAMLAGRPTVWDKTRHEFPDLPSIMTH